MERAARAYEDLLKLKPIDGQIKAELLEAKRNLGRSGNTKRYGQSF